MGIVNTCFVTLAIYYIVHSFKQTDFFRLLAKNIILHKYSLGEKEADFLCQMKNQKFQ